MNSIKTILGMVATEAAEAIAQHEQTCAPENPRMPEKARLQLTLEKMALIANELHEGSPPKDTADYKTTLHDIVTAEAVARCSPLFRRLVLGDDAALLDFFDKMREDMVEPDRDGDPELIGHEWRIQAQCSDVRTAIRAEIEREAQPKPDKSDALPF